MRPYHTSPRPEYARPGTYGAMVMVMHTQAQVMQMVANTPPPRDLPHIEYRDTKELAGCLDGLGASTDLERVRRGAWTSGGGSPHTLSESPCVRPPARPVAPSRNHARHKSPRGPPSPTPPGPRHRRLGRNGMRSREPQTARPSRSCASWRPRLPRVRSSPAARLPWPLSYGWVVPIEARRGARECVWGRAGARGSAAMPRARIAIPPATPKGPLLFPASTGEQRRPQRVLRAPPCWPPQTPYAFAGTRLC
jgi:hypothetical protein